jgi:hypothetical protein
MKTRCNFILTLTDTQARVSQQASRQASKQAIQQKPATYVPICPVAIGRTQQPSRDSRCARWTRPQQMSSRVQCAPLACCCRGLTACGDLLARILLSLSRSLSPSLSRTESSSSSSSSRRSTSLCERVFKILVHHEDARVPLGGMVAQHLQYRYTFMVLYMVTATAVVLGSTVCMHMCAMGCRVNQGWGGGKGRGKGRAGGRRTLIIIIIIVHACMHAQCDEANRGVPWEAVGSK